MKNFEFEFDPDSYKRKINKTLKDNSLKLFYEDEATTKYETLKNNIHKNKKDIYKLQDWTIKNM